MSGHDRNGHRTPYVVAPNYDEPHQFLQVQMEFVQYLMAGVELALQNPSVDVYEMKILRTA